MLASTLLLIGWSESNAQKQIAIDPVNHTDGHIGELDTHFHNALVNYKNGKYLLAANEVQKSASYIKAVSNEAKENDKKAIITCYEKLVSLTNSLQTEKIESSENLNDIFAKTHYTISRHHYINAVVLESNKEMEKANREMRSAGKHLTLAARWSSDELNKDLEVNWKVTEKAGSSIGNETKISAEEFRNGMKIIAFETEKLGAKIFSNKEEKYHISYWIEEAELREMNYEMDQPFGPWKIQVEN